MHAKNVDEIDTRSLRKRKRMVEYLETVLESSDSKESKMEKEKEEPVVPSSNDRKKHLSTDSAGKAFPGFKQWRSQKCGLGGAVWYFCLKTLLKFDFF
jgi:hypothetical protein